MARAYRMDWRVLAFTLAVSILTGLLFGLIPAFGASQADLNVTLRESGSRSGTGLRQNKARAVLVVAETALALILLVGAALLIRTFAALRGVDPGFSTHNVLTMNMSLTGPRFSEDGRRGANRQKRCDSAWKQCRVWKRRRRRVACRSKADSDCRSRLRAGR